MRIHGILVLLSLIAVTVGGCAPLQPRLVQMPAHKETKTLKILKADFEGKEISKQAVLDVITNSLMNAGESGQIIVHTTPGAMGRMDTVKGVKVKAVNNKIEITYSNSYQWTTYQPRKTQTTGNTDTVADFSVIMTEDSLNYYVKLEYPSSLKIIPGRDNIGMEVPRYGDDNKIIQDLDVKFDAIQMLNIKRSYNMTGEINAKYGANAIFANFGRMLGRALSSNKSEAIVKHGVYNLKYTNQNLHVHVSVSPYRNGSKVTYSLDLPYYVSTVITLSGKDVNNIRREIEKIVND